MNNKYCFTSFSLATILNASLVLGAFIAIPVMASSAPSVEQAEPEKGPHRGRMLRDGDFAIELSIFETGVPPEFRIWATYEGQALDPKTVDLNIKLTRLGNVVDDINFKAQNDFLRGDMEIYEPHSFVVTITATYQNKTHRWEYDNFEGRTTIENAVAEAMEIQTGIAGPVTLHQTIPSFGKLALPNSAQHAISARFDGVITKLHVDVGDEVKKGQTLLTVDSNESLKPYQVKAPSHGVISDVFANTGELTANRTLIKITNKNTLIAKLAVYPNDYERVRLGANVSLKIEGIEQVFNGKISLIEPQVRSDQARMVWVKLENESGLLAAGNFVSAHIEVATIDVPIAVKRTGLQGFRDFTVVYAKVGEQYEVRMLELGQQDNEWVEVLGGLKPGTEYVTENSYILKADIEKSGASHDH